MPRIERILETALHVEDVERAKRFYETVIGLTPLFTDARLAAFDAGEKSILLLFKKGASTTLMTLPGGAIPPHDGAGTLHFAFAIAAAELQSWEDRLGANGVAIEARMEWPRGGKSLYFRDPDGHLLELATPGLWATY